MSDLKETIQKINALLFSKAAISSQSQPIKLKNSFAKDSKLTDPVENRDGIKNREEIECAYKSPRSLQEQDLAETQMILANLEKNWNQQHCFSWPILP